MCLYPRLIKNKKYTATKKNGGLIPKVDDERKKYVPIGCGKCMECIKKKTREYQQRLCEEVKADKSGIFVTLTLSNESYKKLFSEINEELKGYDIDNAIATLAVRRFLERWRKKYKKSIKHWLTTELGHNGTENIHLHGILWTDIDSDEITRIWQSGEDGGGYTWIGDSKKGTGYVNEKTVNYIIKYVSKVDEKHKTYKPKILSSAGIGKNYLTTHNANQNKYKKKIHTMYIKTIKAMRWLLQHTIEIKYTAKKKEKTYGQKNQIKI